MELYGDIIIKNKDYENNNSINYITVKIRNIVIMQDIYKIIVPMILLFIVIAIVEYNTVDVIQVTVVDKERIVTGSGENISSKFLVYTEGEVFQNTDNILFLKFGSADVQNRLRPDSTYTVKVNGYRIPSTSSFRNILEIIE
jgi:hypothetical protein